MHAYLLFVLSLQSLHYALILLSAVCECVITGNYINRKQMLLLPVSSREREMDGESEASRASQQGKVHHFKVLRRNSGMDCASFHLIMFYSLIQPKLR